MSTQASVKVLTLSAKYSKSFSFFYQRKLDEVISALDEAVQPTPERPPPPKRTIVSIYATLAKYGIPTSSNTYPRKSRKPKSKPPITTFNSLPLTSLYRPSSLPSLLARLETFRLSTFGSKPAPIDSLPCALAGWVNEGKERLVCGICKGSWVMASVYGLKSGAGNSL
jgi:C3HC zinc finger-like